MYYSHLMLMFSVFIDTGILILEAPPLYNSYSDQRHRPNTPQQYSPSKILILTARHARYDASHRYTQTKGTVTSNNVKKMKPIRYKLSEKADQEKTWRELKKLLVKITKH
ncbi:hypothetical protein N7495_004643 [Penicillium taxi]|uniref:uncharacterized protein n=1 Tax=Penicillium taxi TaxID=168475 RepID=UPI002545A864|nr:uncharacterized protein N7495_004643 [Penicillium taxi]KAJ5899899.1 hypothetical protein N7495_004643 [Penicillium taxi]